ncbi:shikimate kinase [Inediibacterium massiliense]|uniref:shikimate kinase n=1 Tax=Inediibacterium massiliense TaxID=1658111 RepID=UPI0006B4D676|nr:shikimate kinase [Inediibacterium massiliense]
MNKKNMVLIGMPGCGKSTIGRILSKKINKEFIDIDEYIEKIEKKTIQEIFLNGEMFFREIEKKAVKEMSQKKDMVISTGGGVVKFHENIDHLKENGVVFFIDRPIDHIIEDINTNTRPLLKEGKEKIYQLYEERYSLYIKYCDYQVKNDNTLEGVIEKILVLWELEK